MRSLTHAEPVWHTVVSLHLVGAAAADLEAACAEVVGWLHEADALCSPFRTDSAINRWHRGECEPPPLLDEVLDLSAHLRERTGGLYDDAVSTANGIQRDPTGVVKGWAVDHAVQRLRERRLTGGQIDAGGDVRVFGSRPDGQPWRLGVAAPTAPERLLDIVEGDELSLATSGKAHGGHIRVAGPDVVRSAAVLGPDLGSADGMATALVAAGEKATDLLHSLDPAVWSALLLYRDGGIVPSAEWPGLRHGRHRR